MTYFVQVDSSYSVLKVMCAWLCDF